MIHNVSWQESMLVKLERIGSEAVSERELFVLSVDLPHDIDRMLELPSKRFVCLIAWDASGVPVDKIARLARNLLDAGAVYFCVWGTGCERVHDLIDEVMLEQNTSRSTECVIMTTWHDKESLEEAIWFSLFATHPDDGCAQGCNTTVGLSINSPDFAARMRHAFSNPAAFSVSIIAEE